MNSPASGLRLEFQAAFVGSIAARAERELRRRPSRVDRGRVVEVPPGRSTNESPRSVRKRKT